MGDVQAENEHKNSWDNLRLHSWSACYIANNLHFESCFHRSWNGAKSKDKLMSIVGLGYAERNGGRREKENERRSS